MVSKTIFMIQKARQLGLTKKELEANYDIKKYGGEFVTVKKKELVRRELKIEQDFERMFYLSNTI